MLDSKRQLTLQRAGRLPIVALLDRYQRAAGDGWEQQMNDDIRARASQFVAALPHAQALGMHVQSISDGEARMDLPYDPRLVGDPSSGVIFGGAVSALMDTCCGLSVFAHPKARVSMATLDLRIDYMRASTPEQTIRAHAVCYHVTHHVAFVRATATDDDGDNPVASAAGAFSLSRVGGPRL